MSYYKLWNDTFESMIGLDRGFWPKDLGVENFRLSEWLSMFNGLVPEEKMQGLIYLIQNTLCRENKDSISNARKIISNTALLLKMLQDKNIEYRDITLQLRVMGCSGDI